MMTRYRYVYCFIKVSTSHREAENLQKCRHIQCSSHRTKSTTLARLIFLFPLSVIPELVRSNGYHPQQPSNESRQQHRRPNISPDVWPLLHHPPPYHRRWRRFDSAWKQAFRWRWCASFQTLPGKLMSSTSGVSVCLRLET